MASQLERHRERFAKDPSDRSAFEALEEHYFLHGAWTELTSLYERHLAAGGGNEAEPGREARIHFRLGQVLEERRLDARRAIACYEEAVRLDPGFRPPQSQLRRMHASGGQWEVALQIAEAEGRTEMRPYERAEFLCEVAAIWWHHLNDPSQAATHYRQALECVPDHLDALTGLARVLDRTGEAEEAAHAWERVLEQQRGPDRAPALEALGALLAGPLAQPERALERYREALAEDPRRERALEALIEAAASRERWEEVAALLERRFDLASGATRRAGIALETGRLLLDRMGDLDAARDWLERAAELRSGDPNVELALAELEQRAGDEVARARHLEQALELGGSEIPIEVTLDSARLALQKGDPARGIDLLRDGLQRASEDPRLWAALGEALDGLDRHEELIEVLERRATLPSLDASERAELWCELGVLFEERLSDADSALEAYQRAYALAPERPGLIAILDRLHRKLERWEPLRELLEEAPATLPPDERVAVLCSLAEVYAEQHEDPARARSALEEALALRPAASRALAGLTRLAERRGDADALLDAYEREARVSQDAERVGSLVREIVRLREGSATLAEALPSIERWTELCPGQPAPLQTRARVEEALGHSEGLRDTLQQLDACLRGRERAVNRRRLGTLWIELGQEEKALAAWRSALEEDPEDRATLEALCGCLEQRGAFEEAVEVCARLIPLLPDGERETRQMDLATLLAERLGDLERALDTLRAPACEPQASATLAERFEALLERTGRYEELAAHWETRRAALSPSDPEVCTLDLHRARLLAERLGRYEEAAGVFRAVLAERPGDPEARQGLEDVLRAADAVEPLVELLAESARETRDVERRRALELERAVLLEERLDRPEPARAILETLPGLDAQRRLEGLLERLGEHSALASHLEARLEQAEEERPELHARIARIAARELGDAERAARHLELALELDPERVDAWRELADLYKEANRPNDLLRALEGELSTGPGPERELTLRARAARLLTDALEEPERAVLHWQRVLELDPTHPEASEFEMNRLEQERDFARMVPLLEARRHGSEQNGAAPETRLPLRLRIAALRADRLDDLRGAIAELEGAIEEMGPVGAVAEPLADFYQRAGELPKRIQLCERAAEACESPAERADWMLRLGQALRQAGEPRRAADAYRSVTVERPDDAEARSALAELYRELDEPGPLARLLEMDLDRRAGAEEIPLRCELAELLGTRLERPEDALVHLRRVVEIDPGDSATRDRAIDLASQLGRSRDALDLIDGALASTQETDVLARLHARRGTLLAGPLGRGPEAVEAYREALRLDPRLPEVRRDLRETLEGLGRTQEALVCLEQEAATAPPEERAVLLVHASHLAESRLASEAAIPWLERLRALRPDDAHVLLRLGDLHRRAGRTEVWLRFADEAAERLSDAAHRRDLHRERARVLAEELRAPRRAIAALEQAHRIDPRHLGVLRELERLYEEAGLPEDLARVLDKQIEQVPEEERRPLRVRLAEVYETSLRAPDRSVTTLWTALHAPSLSTVERMDLLRRLGDALRLAERWEEYARVAEQELEALPAEPVFDERRRVVQHTLARTYERELGRPAAALPHLRALLAAAPASDGESVRRSEAEERLIRILRAQGAHVELAQRLAARLERRPADVTAALELARLREESLWAPAAAAETYRKVLEQQPTHREALRGLRRTSERLGDWREMARALEAELALAETVSGSERAALWRRLGEVCWKRLGETTQASRAFASALEQAPRDLSSLRALQQLCESMEDWRGALDFYASEIDLLADGEPERRHAVWLRTAELARSRLDDPERAERAYQEAARVAPLPNAPLAVWAALLRRLGDLERHAEVFRTWCDAADAPVEAHHHVELAQVLVRLERRDEALERVERALAADVECGPAWVLAAELREAKGERAGAAEAWSEAARRVHGREAADAWLRAASQIESSEPGRAAEWLEKAVNEDPAHARAHARRARILHGLGRTSLAEESARRALDLTGEDELDVELQLESALIGARAAQLAERHTEASRFADGVLGIEPAQPEALAIAGEARFRLGDLQAAREVLEQLIETGSSAGRPEHRVMLAGALEGLGDTAAALARYQEAADLDPTLSEAHAGAVRLLDGRGDRLEAADALARWAAQTADRRRRAELLVDAAERIREAEAPPERWEGLLREAVTVDPSFARGWERLATQLWACERADDALMAAERGLELEVDEKLGAAFWRVRAQVLESRGSDRDAAEAYCEWARLDPRAGDAVLAGARLLRASGAWQEAAALLRGHLARDPGEDRLGRARFLLQLGRLLAGPLESVEEAIESYESALREDPQLVEAREALAELLVHTPSKREEAIRLHRDLLADRPTRVASVRALTRLAHEQGHEEIARGGLSLLRSLGASSREEEQAAEPNPPLRAARNAALDDPLWECVRIAAQEAAEVLAEALGSFPRAEEPPSHDPLARYRSARVAAEAALGAPALLPLSDGELGETLRLMARLVLAPDSARGDGNLVNALSRALGRRVRRRLKRILGDSDPARIDAIDFAAWRRELRWLANAVALDADGVSLRSALLALLADEAEAEVQNLAAEADLTPWVEACPAARDLVGRVMRAWTEGL